MNRDVRHRQRSKAQAAGELADETRKKARAIELFHLAFMQVAATRLRPDDYALKGGGNLRFFLRSGRRSADLDLDYLGRKFDDFAERVGALLQGPALRKLLQLREIQLLDLRLRKDTATVKRWMFKLARPGMEDATSKIEFSSRPAREVAVLEQSDLQLARKLGGVGARLNHYPPPAAIAQKVEALIERSKSEPRDVFDLDHLFRQYPGAVAQAPFERDRALGAAKIAEEIPYAHYQELVEPYLDEDISLLYSGEDAWIDMQARVVAQLRERAGAQR